MAATMMRSFACLLPLVALAIPTAARADVVRDHRDNAAPAPVVRDHRDGDADRDRPVVEVHEHHHRHRPGPGFMLPLRVDIGATGENTMRGFASGIGGSIGIHWASLSPGPTSFDAGVGVFGELLGVGSGDPNMPTDNVTLGGAYVEVGHTLAQGSFWRTWASGRGEYLASSAFDQSKTGFGATGRLSAELYVGGVGLEPRGIFIGSYALGVYVEAGARQVASGVSPFHVGGGLTFSTPFVIGG